MMRPEPSVHDNFVYAYTVNCEGRRVTLHTEYRDLQPQEFTDVIFSDVVAHSFEHVLRANILFDVEEDDVESLIQGNAAVFEKSWRWGWPPIEYGGDLALLIKTLRSQSVRAFTIGSSYGLSGWVLAGSYERQKRDEPARVA
ncbi:MAG TPA: hypothetical protein VGR35_16775 [Tepidisphaeraceae bacterium]|nr:hypothetical protein [Tepidisphaeraceae bacterium]